MSAALVPLVLVATIGVLLLLEGRAESARTESKSVVDAGETVNHLHATLLEELTRVGLRDPAAMDQEVAAEEAAASASINLLDSASSFGFDTYLPIASRVWELRRTGRQTEAIYISDVRLIPAFDVLHRNLDARAAYLDERAESTELVREVGSTLTLILGGLFLIVVFRRAERTRRLLVAGESRQSALEESEMRFESLLAKSSDLVTVLDRDGRVTFQSSSIEQMLGWKVGDVLGHDFRDFLEGDGVDRLSSILEHAESRPDSQRSVSLQLRRADAELLSVEALVIGGLRRSQYRRVSAEHPRSDRTRRPRGSAAASGLPRSADDAPQPSPLRGPSRSRLRPNHPRRPLVVLAPGRPG